MSDSLRTERPRAADAAPDRDARPDHDAKIEQLLLRGLDHYFAAQYDQAINVWTRALFLDRSHARARAYIERARSALAERQRKSEELLHTGVAAFERGEGGEARRLLHEAMDEGAPPDEALAVLDRLNRRDAVRESAGEAGSEVERKITGAAANAIAGEADWEIAREIARENSARSIEVTAPIDLPVQTRHARRHLAPSTSRGGARSRTGLWLGLSLAAIVSSVAYVATVGSLGLPAWLVGLPESSTQGRTGAPFARDTELPLPRRGEAALMRARALAAGGHLRDALAMLDVVRATDPQKPEANRLRADIQRQLLALASSVDSSPAEGRPGERLGP